MSKISGQMQNCYAHALASTRAGSDAGDQDQAKVAAPEVLVEHWLAGVLSQSYAATVVVITST
jgi:hypothetical protein